MRLAPLAAALLASAAASASAASLEDAGAAFTELVGRMRSVGLGRPAPPLKTAAELVAGVKLADEPEIRACPAQSQEGRSDPDPDLFTYVGYRWVRADGTTCDARPSDEVFYLEPASRELSYDAGASEARSSFEYALDAAEYKVLRRFFLRTQLDGTRRFHHHDGKVSTGKRVPETVLVEFQDRAKNPVLPWLGAESFTLRYGVREGASLSASSTQYDYEIGAVAGPDAQGRLRTKFTARPARVSRRTPPDAKAVALELSLQGTRPVIELKDAWAKYYAGEKLGVKIRLWRSVFLLGDKVAYEIETSVDAAPRVVIDLSDPKWDAFRKEAIRSGKEYYADWSFSRPDSRFTTGGWVEKPRTGRVRF